jgi:hypothetical protein
VVNDYLVSDPAATVSLADPDVAALVQNLIDTAKNLAPPHRHGVKNRLIAAASMRSISSPR